MPRHRSNAYDALDPCWNCGSIYTTTIGWPWIRQTGANDAYRFTGGAEILCLVCSHRRPKVNQPPRMGTRVITEKVVREMGKIYEDDPSMSLNDVARALCCSRTTVSNYFHDYGIKLHPQGGSKRQHRAIHLDPLDVERAEFLYWWMDYSFDDLAKEFHISASTMRAIFVREGLRIRNDSQARSLAGRNRARKGTEKNLHRRHKQVA